MRTRGVRRCSRVVSLILLAVGIAWPLRGEDRSPKEFPGSSGGSFLRISTDAKKAPTALETAVVRFGPAKPTEPSVRVDLIAAVHLGEKSYYDALNRLFDTYDVVLYELVAPKGTRIAKGATHRSDSPLSMVQNFFSRVLELQFQLDQIDYTKKNLVHADLSAEEMRQAMAKRGDTMWTMLARLMAASLVQSAGDDGSSDARLIAAMFNRNRALALKRIVAEQFLNMDGSISALEGPNGSVLIADRNAAAIQVLRQQIDAGHKRLAIFYGGGHMADFRKRLQTEFQLVPQETKWLVAWNLSDPKPEAKSNLGKPAGKP
jgi:hypothetical protein